jgi:hypothetical protein
VTNRRLLTLGIALQVAFALWCACLAATGIGWQRLAHWVDAVAWVLATVVASSASHRQSRRGATAASELP